MTVDKVYSIFFTTLVIGIIIGIVGVILWESNHEALGKILVLVSLSTALPTLLVARIFVNAGCSNVWYRFHDYRIEYRKGNMLYYKCTKCKENVHGTNDVFYN